MIRHLLCLALPFLAAACHSSGTHAPNAREAAARANLLGAVKSLAGTWEMTDQDGAVQVTEFRVTSGGSAVREVMFPGAEHEMTNMYHLDGDELVVTHYCAGGNQPRLVATGVEDGRIAFHLDSVSNLAGDEDHVMGELTLVLVDRDHLQQHWRAFSNGQTLAEHEMTFAFERRR